MTEKFCPHCKTVKSLVGFYKHPNGRPKSWCKVCVIHETSAAHKRNPEMTKRRWVKYQLKQYGLTVEQFQQMLSDQERKCKICGITPKASFHVDHCHKTGKVRGLLCKGCNQGLGLFRDDPSNLVKASEYLRKASA